MRAVGEDEEVLVGLSGFSDQDRLLRRLETENSRLGKVARKSDRLSEIPCMAVRLGHLARDVVLCSWHMTVLS